MIKIQWLASIWRQNDQKCWVTSQNIQNNAKLQKWSKYNELHRLDVKTIETMLNYKSDQNPMTWIKFDVKTFKTKQIYKTDQITMNCIDWMSQNDQNKAKLQKWSKSNDFHRFDVKMIKMLSYVAKHSEQR